MLDIKLVRENPQAVKKSLEKRKDEEKIAWVDELLAIDSEWKKVKAELDDLRHRRNILAEEINRLKKDGKDVSSVISEAKNLPQAINGKEKLESELLSKMRFYLMRIPNVLHESVPYGKDSTENKVIRSWGKQLKPKFELKPHGLLAEDLGIADFQRAAKIAGTGFNYLKSELAMLDLALQQFSVDFLVKRGYKLILPPLMMNRKTYEGVTDIADFENVMYKVENEDLYLIATSEHPMAGMYMNEVIDESELPIKFVGRSPCFRKEIGSHGVDTRGLFRMHQFHKVEQFIFCRPDDSWKFHEELQKNSEEMIKKLKIPYRVVNICTGDIGIVAAKKYDIEAWFPRSNSYMEIGSNSNCISYQAVRLNIRFQRGQEREYVHTLNNTGIATSRLMVAILENCQQENGLVKVPTVLQKYMGNIKEIGRKK